MNYHLKSSKRPNKGYIFSVYILAIFLLLVFAFTLIFPKFFPALFSDIAHPFWKTKVTLTEDVQKLGKSKDELLLDNQSLTERIKELETKEMTVSMLEQENVELKAILGRVSGRTLTLAVVLEKPPQTPYDTLIIDLGTKDGISVGERVLAEEAIMIGHIAEVSPKTSKVVLYSSPSEKFDARIGSSSIETSITGRGGGNFEATLPREAAVKIGDNVIVPNISPLLFGNVSAVIADTASAFEKILIKTPININELNKVEVEKVK